MVWTHRDQGTSGVRGGQGPFMGKDTYRGGYTWACPDLPTVDILNVIH